ncbi:hypothetical protein [Ruegeria sp.]|uniref:hypothetical protein n=1 Tax=Ruegeria sp. TaxID=1879320 RepID=UPI003B5B0313
MTVRIRFCDFRAAEVCKDSRILFFKRYADQLDITWRDFLRNGATADQLRKAGDQLDKIDELERTAIEREAKGGR